ncbi:rough deal protein C-terminal region-domain-containing protein [Syncephalis pseudoplumigaleata]|uniref:Rough deal protein C-terminal region-domain-containing protein n=1 Tax=Syncephalis pseudoplumigaleata TaxID=1712513 RepID=A0A4P9Z0X2_9FUNG|nr:rough deal protein C-terminal region-domain-containing protein [Syncephalis pseudoplumigaleata]|eukprot:RKP26113.1 rough deal protein C-terminal region-domain-containing protein [Syncephalis pseudoplumigaleata]
MQQQIQHGPSSLLAAQLDQFLRYEMLRQLLTYTEQGAYASTVEAMAAANGCIAKQAHWSHAPPLHTSSLMEWLFEGQYQHFWENTLVMDTATMLTKAVSAFIDCNDGSGSRSNALPDMLHYLREHRSLSSALRLIMWSAVARQRQQLPGQNIEWQDHPFPMGHCLFDGIAAGDGVRGVPRTMLTSVGAQYDRLAQLASLGVICAAQWKQRTFMADCRQLAVNAYWWRQFRRLGAWQHASMAMTRGCMEFSDNAFRASQSTGDYQRTLLPTLLERAAWDTSVVFEYADAYQLDEDETCFACLHTMLLHRSELDAVQLAVIMARVKNKEKLIAWLETTCIPSISAVDYERLQMVYEQIRQLDAAHDTARSALMILTCLMDYERLARQQCTMSSLDGKEEQASSMDQRAHRIPFHALRTDAWSTLSAVVDEHSVHRLLPLHIPLQLSPDQFYGRAIGHVQDEERAVMAEASKQYEQQLIECKIHAALCANGWHVLKPHAGDPLTLLQALFATDDLWTASMAREQNQKLCSSEHVGALIDTLCQHYKQQRDKLLTTLFTLLIYSHNKASHKIPTVARIRALTVLFMVADAQDIARVHRYEEVREYLHLLLYMVDFEDLRLSQSLKEFRACDKLALARSLWISHAHDVKVIKLIGHLCIDYKLYDVALWEQLLKRLVQACEVAWPRDARRGRCPHPLTSHAMMQMDHVTRMMEHIESVPALFRLAAMPAIKDALAHAAIDALATTGEHHEEELRLMALLHRHAGLWEEASVVRLLDHAQRVLSSITVLRIMTCFPDSDELIRRRKMLVGHLSMDDMKALLASIEVADDEVDDEADGHGTTMKHMGASYRISIEALHEAIFDRIDSEAFIEEDRQTYLSSLTQDGDTTMSDTLDPLEIYLYAKHITL